MKSSERKTGTVVRGIRCPIIRQGDHLADTILESLLSAARDRDEGFSLRDRDVVAITESVVARAEGNYATVDDIAKDVNGRSYSRRHLPHPQPQPFRNLPQRYREGLQEGGSYALLPLRRGG